MGKHSKEEEKKKINVKINKKYLIIIIVFIILTVGIYMATRMINLKEVFGSIGFKSITNSTTIEGQRLVFKSNSEYNKIMEYTFEEDKIKTVKIYEQFENKENFDEKKEMYDKKKDIQILKINEKDLSIEFEKLDFGSDKDMSYEEIYDKYLVQIIGAYEQI